MQSGENGAVIPGLHLGYFFRTAAMAHLPQVKIPATYIRGGTSKGVFFRLQDLPERCQVPGAARDKLFMRVIGSPDPYSAQIDGMGGATSSTSKCVILSKSSQPEHDVDYLYGQISIDKAFVDWSGNCGNLSTAAGAFAIHAGLVDPARIPENGTCVVRIWQANIQKTIIAHVPVAGGQVQETGDFELDGVTFPAAEIVLEFLDPSDDSEEGGSMFPTGNLVDDLEVPGIGTFKATMISAVFRPSSSTPKTSATRALSCARPSMVTRCNWRASSRFALPAPCAWG
jgi:2-methylaconitate cis-trans-isomerase PrpF